MDMLMPEMDGVAATRFIRQQLPAPLCHIPILGLTANANDNSRQQCLQAGMNDLIFKPFQREDLIRTIHQLLGLVSV
jgi:CheY-like chemotaxis protein